MDNVECPFCGTWFDPSLYHPELHIDKCPLEGYKFSAEKWNKRPSKKEQPAATAVESEVVWLRSLVETWIGKK